MPEPSGFTEVHQAIKADFMDRLPGYHKSRCEGLTLLASTVLNTRSVNLMEFAAALPRDIGFIDHRYQYVSRVLGNSHINCDDVMQAYATEVFTKLGAQGQTIVLMIDQSHANDGHEVLMVSVRMRDRALPVSWRVRKTKGAIGFPVQKDLLDGLLGWLPEGAKVVLMGDRFYGTAALVAWCQAAGWGYRLRMKGNITLQHQGGEMKSGEIVTLMPEGLVNAELHGSGVFSNIGALHEPGHQEPWIIAMDDAPGKYTVLDYGMRWGIEAMFSDFKSRGFGHHPKPDHEDGPVGTFDPGSDYRHVLGNLDRFRRGEKHRRAKRHKKGIRKALRSLCSLFKQGLRRIRRCFAGYDQMPKLWDVWII